MTAKATHDDTVVSVTSASKREASEMRNDSNTSSTPPHPVEEAVALTPERILTAVERLKLLLAIEGAHQSPRNTAWQIKVTGSDLAALLSALERQKEALERIAAEGLHEPLLLSVREIREVARSALGGQHG